MENLIVVLGGPFTSVGKTAFTASLGRLLKSRGIGINVMKFDGYLNLHSGLMNPYSARNEKSKLHADEEVFVLEDGYEGDKDLGTYERFLGCNLKSKNNLTGGQVMEKILDKQKEREYPPGKVLEMEEMKEISKNWIKNTTNSDEVNLLEVGGTVGDEENKYIIEAAKELDKNKNIIFILLTYLPKFEGRFKLRPTEEMKMSLSEIGVKPDILVARTKGKLEGLAENRLKSLFDVTEDSIINLYNFKNIYNVPNLLKKQKIYRKITKYIDSELNENITPQWFDFVSSMQEGENVSIGIFGKCAGFDSYISLIDAIKISGTKIGLNPNLKWLDEIKNEKLGEIDGVILTEDYKKLREKVKFVKLARERNVPLLGISAGFQITVMELLKNLLNKKDSLEEIKKKCLEDVGLKVGSFKTNLEQDSFIKKLYGSKEIKERHRHDKEVKKDIVKEIEKKTDDFKFSGFSEDGYPDVLESNSHDFFLAMNPHIEFGCRPLKVNPVIEKFIESAKYGKAQ